MHFVRLQQIATALKALDLTSQALRRADQIEVSEGKVTCDW